MGKFSYWNVEFPSKTLVFSKVASAFRKLALCHQPWPSLAFPSSKAPLAFPAGAWDVSPYQSSSACWTESVELLVLLPFLHCPLQVSSCNWRQSETTLSCTKMHWGQTLRVSLLSAVFARLAGCQLVGPGKSSSRAWRYWGFVWIPPFTKPWGFFWGCEEQHLLLHWIPIQQQVLYFLSLPCKGRLSGPPGLWLCCLCSHEVWSSSLNLWSLLTLPLIASWQRFWVFTIIPSVLLRSSTSQTPTQGSNVTCSRSLGSTSASFASDSDTWLQWNQCQPSHHCQ